MEPVRPKPLDMRQTPTPSFAMRTSTSRAIAARLAASLPFIAPLLALLLAFLAFAGGADAQEAGTVAGTVVKAGTLTPVEGAQVQVQGTSLGAMTDASGRFRIAGVSGDQVTLQVRRLSFEPATQLARVGDLAVRVVLSEVSIELNEVVVTGVAGAEQRRTIGNAVATIDASAELQRSAAPDLGTLLQARAPGVIVAPGTGRVGSGPTIWIRGRSTLSLSNEPLIYIDGVRANNAVNQGPCHAAASCGLASQNALVASRLNDISPEDIERIEIIKGPAAATIYGTEAANGVIQIITKKGTPGTTRWTARVEQKAVWFQDPEGRIPTNYFRDSTGQIVAWNPIQQEKDRGTPIFHTGHSQGYHLSLSGGRERLAFYLSGTYNDDEGIEPNNYGQSFSSHASVNVSPSEKLDIGSSLHYTRSTAHLGADGGLSSMLGISIGHPLLFPATRGFVFAPPEVPQQLYDNAQDINRFIGGLTVNHRPISWWAHRLTVGLDYTADDSRGLERYASSPEMRAWVAGVGGPSAANGRITQNLRNNSYITGDYSGTATFNLTPAISSASSIGGQFVRKQLKSSGLSGLEFPTPGVETVSGTTTPGTPTQSLIVNTTAGIYGQQRFGWNDRLFLTGALRVDNNSAFGDDFDWVTYPKVSASWIISEEPFWSGLTGVVNTLKLRSAYGQSGQQPNTFAALRTFSNAPRGNSTAGITPDALGNPDLKPERASELEVGFEAGLFDRVSLDFTYYTRRTKDAILTQNLAPSGGWAGDQAINVGETTNRGIELQARVQALELENVSWEIAGNVSTNRDRVEDIGNLSPGTGLWRNAEGYPIQGFWTKRVASATRNPDHTIVAASIRCVAGPGVRPDSVLPCAQALPIFVGRSTPNVSGAISNSVTLWNRLTLYGLVDFKRGHKLLNSNDANRCSFGVCDARFFPERFSTEYLASIAQSSVTAGVLDPFIQDASFVKLREISATYELPGRLLTRMNVAGASVTVAGRNLATWTDYNGIDPDVRYQGNFAQDQGMTPALTQFVASLNVRF